MHVVIDGGVSEREDGIGREGAGEARLVEDRDGAVDDVDVPLLLAVLAKIRAADRLFCVPEDRRSVIPRHEMGREEHALRWPPGPFCGQAGSPGQVMMPLARGSRWGTAKVVAVPRRRTRSVLSILGGVVTKVVKGRRSL